VIFAFDGTWNTAKNNDTKRHTNVWRFYSAYQARNKSKWDFYWPGVGTRLGTLGRVIGGAFGAGGWTRLDEAYDRLCAAWQDGERDIDVVGFSRGAAIALDFCNIVQERKIREPRTETIAEAQPRIRFLGLWDAVAAFGPACLGNPALNLLHRLRLPRESLQYAFHALALDERRPSFLPTRLPGAYEVWFRGVHSDVGGGNGNTGLNDITLKWMFSKGMAAGLPIAAPDIASLTPDPGTFPKLQKLPLNIRLVGSLDRLHYSVGPTPDCKVPPASCRVETPADEQTARPLGAEPMTFLSEREYGYFLALMANADAAARQLEVNLDPVREALATLVQGRITLVTNDDEFERAAAAVARLVLEMVRSQREKKFAVLNEFFLTEALFRLSPLFPLTD
jgi:hypothetical protein